MQILVDDESLKLLTINTEKGFYRFDRLPLGIKVAPGIFQQVMDTMFSGLEFATAYLDDILIKGENKEVRIQHL